MGQPCALQPLRLGRYPLIVLAISSDGVVLQGAQHPIGGIAHDLPLLVGQLFCPVLHDPGDPWQVMDHPWREPLAGRQERMLVVGEQAAAGRAPRGRRCHGAEYGPRLGVGPSRGLSRAEPAASPHTQGPYFAPVPPAAAEVGAARVAASGPRAEMAMRGGRRRLGPGPSGGSKRDRFWTTGRKGDTVSETEVRELREVLHGF
jgi:hypothetical protein